MLELIISLFLMKNDGLGIFFLSKQYLYHKIIHWNCIIYMKLYFSQYFIEKITQCYILNIFYTPLNVWPIAVDGYNFWVIKNY